MLFTLLAIALSGLAIADEAWTTEDVELQRWPAGVEGSVVTRALDSGSQVQIVTEQGDQVRVYTSGSFGWISKALLSEEPPAPTEAEDADAPADEAAEDEGDLPFDER